MAARYPSVRLVALTFFLLVAGSSFFASEVVEADIFDDIGDSISAFVEDVKAAVSVDELVTCPSEHQTAIDVCHSMAFPFYRLQPVFEDASRQESCCNRLAANHCIELVAKAYCSEDDQDTSSFDDFLEKIIPGDQCQDYQKVGQCTDPILALCLLFITSSILIFFVYVVHDCFCGFCL